MGGVGRLAFQCLWRGYDFTSVELRPQVTEEMLKQYAAQKGVGRLLGDCEICFHPADARADRGGGGRVIC